VSFSSAGIRSYPYSTSLTTNPLKYGSLATLTEVHDIGEVWAEIWHELNAGLVIAQYVVAFCFQELLICKISRFSFSSGFSTNKFDPTLTGGNTVALLVSSSDPAPKIVLFCRFIMLTCVLLFCLAICSSTVCNCSPVPLLSSLLVTPSFRPTRTGSPVPTSVFFGRPLPSAVSVTVSLDSVELQFMQFQGYKISRRKYLIGATTTKTNSATLPTGC